ncbi:MAG: peroxiredoxin [Nitrososphaerales archaeon]
MPALKVGEKAPDFSAHTTDGQISLKDYRDKNLVIYFYVKDQTPGCTMQSCSLRKGMHRIKEQEAEVLGVSVDDVESHKKFKEKEDLNFPLIADTDYSISRAFGAFNEERKVSRRMTFVIDKNGTINQIFSKVDVRAHADEVIEALKAIK